MIIPLFEINILSVVRSDVYDTILCVIILFYVCKWMIDVTETTGILICWVWSHNNSLRVTGIFGSFYDCGLIRAEVRDFRLLCTHT